MEYEQHEDGTLTPLPQQNIDTGMGLERLAAIVQDVHSVYETDGYQAIMDWVAKESGVAFGESEQATKAHRILADHGRGMTFLVADGVQPSNEGRGYVLRRVIRRAVQQAQTIGLEELWRLTDVVVEQMGDAFPELRSTPPTSSAWSRARRSSSSGRSRVGWPSSTSSRAAPSSVATPRSSCTTRTGSRSS